MPLSLLPINGGQPIVLDAPELVLGRHPECDRVIRGHDSVSRRHCRLVPQGHYVQVFDLGSLNGVRVNGHRIQHDVPLAPGDRLRLGSAEFVLALQSEAALTAVQSRSAPTAAADLKVTQPITLAYQDDESGAGHAAAVTPSQSSSSADAAPRTRRLQPSGTSREQSSARQPAPPISTQPPKDSFTDKSWDLIVAMERRAPEVTLPRPATRSAGEEAVSPERGFTLGYVSRPSAGAGWNVARRGLSMLCWSGIAAGLVFMLIWESCSVPVFVHAARTATSVFIPFGEGIDVTPGMAASFGFQMVLLGAIPLIVCVVMRNSVEDAFWPAVAVAVLGLLFGQVMRPGNARAINVLSHAGLSLLLVALVGMLAGLCLACTLPRRSGLAAWGVAAAAATLSAVAFTALVLQGDSLRITGITLPVRRPDSDPLLWGLILSAVASQGLVLYFMRRVAAHVKSAPLIESIDACLVYMVVASVGGIGCWFAVTRGGVAPGWADTLLVAAAAGGTISLAWIGQTAGYVRSQLR